MQICVLIHTNIASQFFVNGNASKESENDVLKTDYDSSSGGTCVDIAVEFGTPAERSDEHLARSPSSSWRDKP